MSAARTRLPATRKRRRLYAVLAGLTMLGVAAALVLVAFEDNIVFFYSPTDLKEKSLRPGQMVRLGGLVVEGSVRRDQETLENAFDLTDGVGTFTVYYVGILPDLFREGQGIVANGTLISTNRFEAEEVLAKHDETYMPPEVQDALEKAGHPGAKAVNSE